MTKKLKAKPEAKSVPKSPAKKAPSTPAQAHEKAVAETEQNSKLWHAVVTGQKPKSAIKYESEGGEMKRVGWPDGMPPGLKEGIAAHSKLFGGASSPPRKVAATGNTKRKVKFATLEGNYDDLKVKLLVDKNPKRGKSAERFDAYVNGMTVTAALKNGVTEADVKWDVAHGFIELQ